MAPRLQRRPPPDNLYAHTSEAQEWREYIEYLQKLAYLTRDVEDVELEELPGAQGLRALRVTVDLVHGDPDHRPSFPAFATGGQPR